MRNTSRHFRLPGFKHLGKDHDNVPKSGAQGTLRQKFSDLLGSLNPAQHGALSAITGAHAHTDLDTVGVNDHHPQLHEAAHNAGAADALSHNDLAGITNGDHHARNHVSRHRAEGADELPINVIAGVAFGQVVGTTIQSNSKNLASVSNDATGVYEVSFDTDFTDANYAVLVTPDSTLPRFATAAGHGNGSVFVYIRDENGTVQNTNFQILAIGNW